MKKPVKQKKRCQEPFFVLNAVGNGYVNKVPDTFYFTHTVCRKNELLKLEWQRVDLKAGLLHFEANT